MKKLWLQLGNISLQMPVELWYGIFREGDLLKNAFMIRTESLAPGLIDLAITRSQQFHLKQS